MGHPSKMTNTTNRIYYETNSIHSGMSSVIIKMNDLR